MYFLLVKKLHVASEVMVLLSSCRSSAPRTLTSRSIFSLLFSILSFGTDKENLFNDQSFVGLRFSFILLVLFHDSAVLL